MTYILSCSNISERIRSEMFASLDPLLLSKGVYATSYLEKNVSLGHSLTVLIWAIFYGEFDFILSLVIFLGISLGAYVGGKFTLKMKIYWMYGIIIALSLAIIFKQLFDF